MQQADPFLGIERLASIEQAYYRAFIEVLDHGITRDHAAEIDLLRRGHLEEYDRMLKLTESGFQLFDFLKFKMSGDKPRWVREA